MWNQPDDKGKSLCPDFYKTETNKIIMHAKEKENINYDLFLNSIALTATVGNDHLSCKNIEKINRLLIKMSISKGIDISQKKSGKLL